MCHFITLIFLSFVIASVGPKMSESATYYSNIVKHEAWCVYQISELHGEGEQLKGDLGEARAQYKDCAQEVTPPAQPSAMVFIRPKKNTAPYICFCLFIFSLIAHWKDDIDGKNPDGSYLTCKNGYSKHTLCCCFLAWCGICWGKNVMISNRTAANLWGCQSFSLTSII